MNYNDFSELLLKKALEEGFKDAEIFMSDGSSFSVNTFEGEIFKYQNSSNRGISFRGTYEENIGYSYSEWIDEKAIDFIIKEAKQNAQIIEEEEQDKLFSGSESYPEICGFSEELQKVSIDAKIKAALEMEKTAQNAHENIKAVDHNGVSYGEGSTSIRNTYGLNVSFKSNSASAYSSARAVKGNETKTGGEYWHGRNWLDFSPEKIGKEAAAEAVSKLDSISVESGKYKVVVQNDAFSSLFGTFSSVFNAENVQKGFSLLAGKLNEEIASPVFTLRDDPAIPDSLNAAPFDGEGVAMYNKAVIENGVLKTFLHNLKTAEKDGVKSTGNASRGYKGSIGISPKNMYVKPSETSLEELIAQVGDGLYITDFGGLHSGTNQVSGDFSLLSGGFLIENGKLTKPVEQITVAGNFFDMLKNIVAVANDLRPASLSPAVAVKELSIAGNKK